MGVIVNGNALRINQLLLKTQMTFSANVLRSVFKNYINWETSVPTGAADLLMVYDPNTSLAPFDLPRKFMGWWEVANQDASILTNQVHTIRILSELRTYYLNRAKTAVKEMRKFRQLIDALAPARDLDRAYRRMTSGHAHILIQ